MEVTEYFTLLSDKYAKHHFMVHHLTIKQRIGPLWNICCMRFESDIGGAKLSRSDIRKVNVCRTIALRHQLIFNYRFMC